ncbi:suppressor of defective silencing [Culex quinquefasciatus]|uniref:Suppressor of defective silencing n=1 Tax=Culex quinquefasciatus TaxID=7176 RepID=B0XB19_CULQU|nr:suppressor of defective silencing [Culex quinquefasciatus]|eukprot:XP_001866841.1 suppressor of defective silencing [Culex quinquefasciatus]
MYQDKLASLKKQLDELRSGTHPEYLRRVKKLEHQYSERIRLNEIYREYLINCVERDYILEKNAAVKEYEEKKVDLKENLMTDFEDRRKMIETERATMELTGDSVDVKPTITRKLRRRPNEPLPVPEKRRKPTTGQLVLLLDEKEVENDLKLISRGKAAQVMRNHQQQQQQQANGGSGSGSSNSHTQIAPITNNGTASIVNNSVVAPSSTIPTPTPLINASYQINSSSVGSSVAAPSTTTTATPSSTVTSSELTLALPQSTTTPAVSSSPVVAASQPSPVSTQPQTAPTTTTPVNGQPPMAAVVPVASQQNSAQPAPLVETRIEDGKLLYERRWFHRGQPVYVEGRDIQRFSGQYFRHRQ